MSEPELAGQHMPMFFLLQRLTYNSEMRAKQSYKRAALMRKILLRRWFAL